MIIALIYIILLIPLPPPRPSLSHTHNDRLRRYRHAKPSTTAFKISSGSVHDPETNFISDNSLAKLNRAQVSL